MLALAVLVEVTAPATAVAAGLAALAAMALAALEGHPVRAALAVFQFQ
jgi:hypothetical protein